MENDFFKSVQKTEMGERLEKLQELYCRLGKMQEQFWQTFDIHCKVGCGTCCEHFHPDITEVEAEFLAYVLIMDGKVDEVLNRISSVTSDAKYCPLYDWDSAYHCTVYGSRPLICRLFAASASHDKSGRLIYHSCKWLDHPYGISTEFLEVHKDQVVQMQDFGMMLEEISSGRTQTYLLAEILPKAVENVQFMIEMVKESNE